METIQDFRIHLSEIANDYLIKKGYNDYFKVSKPRKSKAIWIDIVKRNEKIEKICRRLYREGLIESEINPSTQIASNGGLEKLKSFKDYDDGKRKLATIPSSILEEDKVNVIRNIDKVLNNTNFSIGKIAKELK